MIGGNNHTVQVLVKILDQATDPLKRISRQVSTMSGDFKNIGSSLGAFSNKMGSVVSHIDKMANSMGKFNMYTSQIQRNIKNISLIGLGATAAVAADAVNKSVDFEFKTTKMQTKMGLIGPGGDAAKKEIDNYILNNLSNHSMSSPSQIADLGIVLGQGGISSKDDMMRLLKDTTNFAEAVDTDPAQAGKMLIASLKGFDLPMAKATAVTDKLAVALNQSLLEADELPHAIGELAGRSKMLGQSFESSLTALMMGRDQGMAAAQTAQDFLHGLRQLSQIGNTEFMTPKRIETFEKAGIDTSFFDTKKRQLKEFPEIIDSLETTLQKQGLMPNREHFYEVVKANNGVIPDGLLDKMSMMPMISKIFGAAGQAPLIMGLQSKYKEIDKTTGVETGNVFYGSEALKKMRDELKESEGAVARVHDKMSETAKFQLGVLSNVWSAAEIKLANDFLPVIKTASNELTKYIGGEGMGGGIDAFSTSLKNASNNLRVTNPQLADLVDSLNTMVTGSIKIGVTLVPTIMEIGESAKKNLVDGEWGNSIWTLPYHAVDNGVSFINDTITNNTKSDAEIAKLPPELQDEANLTRGLVKGGVALVAAGAIIKILEMAFRSISMGGTVLKKGIDMGAWLLNLMGGSNKKGSAALEALKNVNINANIVNVYGRVVNMFDGPGANGPNPTPLPPRGGPPKPVPMGIPLLPIAVAATVVAATFAVGDVLDKAKDPKNTHNEDASKGPTGPTSIYAQTGMTGGMSDLERANKYRDEMLMTDFGINTKAYGNLDSNQRNNLLLNGVPVGPPSQSRTIGDEQTKTLADYLQSVKTDSGVVISQGFNDMSKSLENVKIENKMSFNPVIQISGTLKEAIPDIGVTLNKENTGINSVDFMNRVMEKEAKRYGH